MGEVHTLITERRLMLTVALEPMRAPNHCTENSLNDEISPPRWATLTGTNLPNLSLCMAHQSWNKSLKVN